MQGHKNIPSANPLFSGIIIAHPILHVSRIRVKPFLNTKRVALILYKDGAL